MILTNKIRCNTCNATIESKHLHDFVGCDCLPSTESWCSVDGGHGYIKRLYGREASFTELSTHTEGDTQ